MWDAIAQKCIAHLKPNDHILVSGRLISYCKSSGDENSGLDFDYRVCVSFLTIKHNIYVISNFMYYVL